MDVRMSDASAGMSELNTNGSKDVDCYGLLYERERN